MDAARSRPVGEGDLDRGRALDDVQRGQDVALGVDDDARAEVLAAGPGWCCASMRTRPARTAPYAVTAAGG